MGSRRAGAHDLGLLSSLSWMHYEPASGSWLLQHPEGQTRLQDIETLQFADALLNLQELALIGVPEIEIG